MWDRLEVGLHTAKIWIRSESTSNYLNKQKLLTGMPSHLWF